MYKYKVQSRENKWQVPRSKKMPPRHRCQFCHRSMKDARKKSEWFLPAHDLGITFIEWIGAFNPHFIGKYFPTLANKISKIRHAQKNADAMFDLIGELLFGCFLGLDELAGSYKFQHCLSAHHMFVICFICSCTSLNLYKKAFVSTFVDVLLA